MRLSDAIATGRVLVPQLEQGEMRGCALGMALLAVGRNAAEIHLLGYEYVVETWPWLKSAPAHCSSCEYWNTTMHGAAKVWLPFDTHVMSDKTMTLDQLIDWVRSIEPQEEAEQVTVTATPEVVHV